MRQPNKIANGGPLLVPHLFGMECLACQCSGPIKKKIQCSLTQLASVTFHNCVGMIPLWSRLRSYDHRPLVGHAIDRRYVLSRHACRPLVNRTAGRPIPYVYLQLLSHLDPHLDRLSGSDSNHNIFALTACQYMNISTPEERYTNRNIP